MSFQSGEWVKSRIKETLKRTIPILKDGKSASPGDIWSIKKILVLDYLIDGFVPIFKKWFKNFYFVDTHCGSGLIRFKNRSLKEDRFPGSAISAALRSTKKPFTNYFFSDINLQSTKILNQRLKSLGKEVGNRSYFAEKRDFAESVKMLENRVKYGNAFLVFVDPTGFTEIEWELMERLLRIKTADIIFTFMTYVVARHRSIVKPGNTYEKSLNKFYGNSNWKPHKKGIDLMKLYQSQIAQHKKYVYDIPVYQKGKILAYNILVATNSKGASNIITSAKRIANVRTETIFSCFMVATEKTGDLSKWLVDP